MSYILKASKVGKSNRPFSSPELQAPKYFRQSVETETVMPLSIATVMEQVMETAKIYPIVVPFIK